MMDNVTLWTNPDGGSAFEPATATIENAHACFKIVILFTSSTTSTNYRNVPIYVQENGSASLECELNLMNDNSLTYVTRNVDAEYTNNSTDDVVISFADCKTKSGHAGTPVINNRFAIPQKIIAVY